MKELMEDLKYVMDNLSTENIYKFHINRPDLLNVNLKRVNILNEDRVRQNK